MQFRHYLVYKHCFWSIKGNCLFVQYFVYKCAVLWFLWESLCNKQVELSAKAVHLLHFQLKPTNPRVSHKKSDFPSWRTQEFWLHCFITLVTTLDFFTFTNLTIKTNRQIIYDIITLTNYTDTHVQQWACNYCYITCAHVAAQGFERLLPMTGGLCVNAPFRID